MNVSVIIPTLNEEKQIGFLLDALKRQSYKLHEVLVIDCHSTDRTAEIVSEYSDVQLIKTEKGVGHQRHIGGSMATGNLLIFFDADVYPHESFVQEIVDVINKKELDIYCPEYVPRTSRFGIKSIFKAFHFLFYLFQDLSPSGAGMCVVVKRDHYHKSGGFQKELTYDDIAFIRSAARKGTFSYGCIPLQVSSRRFEQQGVLKTTGKYMLLSCFFVLGLFRQANRVEYKFGIHK